METSRNSISSHLTTSAGRAIFWCVVCALCAYGVFFIYSTGYIADEFPVRPNWWRQLIWLGASASICFIVASMNPHGLAWRTFVWSGYGLSLLLLILVLMFGRTIGGARRWLAIGPVMIQPAEFANFFTLMALCESIAWPTHGWRQIWLKIIAIFAMLLFPVALIMSAPSFGNALSVFPSIVCIIGIRYFNRKIWGLLVVLATLTPLIAWGTVLVLREQQKSDDATATQSQKTFVSRFLHGYHSKRLKSYLTPGGDWNERQSIMTLASGGPYGKGYLQGTMKSLGYLPRTVAPTDFIFSVIGEEFGFFMGCLPVLLLYAALFIIGFHWASHASDAQAALRSVGVLMLLAVHVFINVGMTVRLIPVIGLPLPLLSYGGSFTLMTFLCLGVLHATSHFTLQDSVYDNPEAANEWILGRLLRIRVRGKNQ